jgi:DNA repair exonuclease SbcCD ATPase subunit
MLILSKKEDAAYEAWLNEIKTKNPDVSEQLDALAGTDAGREIFRGGLREADYYRRLNEFRDQREQFERQQQKFKEDVTKQYSWWEQAQPAFQQAQQEAQELKSRLAAYEDQMKEYGMDPKDVRAAIPAVDTNTNNMTNQQLEQLRQQVQMMDQAFPQVLTGMLAAQQQAFQEGLPFDPAKVVQEVYQNRVDPLTAWNKLTTEQRQGKVREQLQKELEKAREEGRKEALSKVSGPDRMMRPAGPSVVDVLRGDAEVMTDPKTRVDASVQDFLQMSHDE